MMTPMPMMIKFAEIFHISEPNYTFLSLRNLFYIGWKLKSRESWKKALICKAFMKVRGHAVKRF